MYLSKVLGKFEFMVYFQESTRNRTLEEAPAPKRTRNANPSGGKATTSRKGKAPAKKATLPTAAPSNNSDVSSEEWETPADSEEQSEVEMLDDGAMPGPSTRPKRSFGSMPAHPRTEHVSDKLRQKIREGEFVDIKQMIPRPRGEKPNKKFALNDGMFEEVEDNSNLAFYPWLDAWIVFMSIHLEFYPADAQGMLRHLEIVKGFHSAGKDGVEYDYQFRRCKSRNADMVWGEFIAELASDIQESKGNQQKKADSAQKKKPIRPPICHKFNNAEGCKFGASCKYAHKCKKCFSMDHPDYRCSRK